MEIGYSDGLKSPVRIPIHRKPADRRGQRWLMTWAQFQRRLPVWKLSPTEIVLPQLL